MVGQFNKPCKDQCHIISIKMIEISILLKLGEKKTFIRHQDILEKYMQLMSYDVLVLLVPVQWLFPPQLSFYFI